jgi:elongation factor P--(R)-beta-lysine ligase
VAVVPDWAPRCDRAALEARAAVLRAVREFFHQRGVLEVQTAAAGATTVTDPAIESFEVPGLGYLQTSPEHQMKRLLAAGAPSIYQIGPVFRAGEAGRLHNPEFTMLEWYRVGFDDRQLMAEVAALIEHVLGPGAFGTVTYAEVVERAPPAEASPGVRASGRDALDLRFALGIESLARGRWFVVDYPADQAALARLREDDPRVAARFELIVDGVELANGYHELADAIELRARMERDLAARRAAGQREPPVDERLLAAMAAGLPPCAGVALGFDRLLMLKLGANRLDGVLPFPAGVA